MINNMNKNELASERLNRILAQDGAYIKNARRRGGEAAAKRGLLNSSVSAGAGERAALEAAMPMAQSDAQAAIEAAGRGNRLKMAEIGANAQMSAAATAANAAKYGDDKRLEMQLLQNELAREQNALAREHDFGLLDDRQGHDLTMQGNQLDFQSGQAEQGRAHDLTMQGNQFDFQGNQAEQDRGIRRDLAQMDNTYRWTMADRNYDQMFTSFQESVMSNPNIPAASRDKYIQGFSNWLSQAREYNRNPDNFAAPEIEWST